MLKQAGNQDRTLFLQAFTKEILFNVQRQQRNRQKEEKEERKRIEKELQKPIEPKPFLFTKYSMRSIHPIHPTYPFQQKTKEIEELEQPIEIPFKSRAIRFKPIQLTPHASSPATPTATIAPIALNLPATVSLEEGEVDLGKLNLFKRDKEITMMECPGPGKFIVIKKAGRVNFTRISLSQSEIDNIIKNFSAKARIPVLGGVFKASVETLTIAAVISEFVGSRFIINKLSPYSILEQQSQELMHGQFQHNKKMQKQFQKGNFLKKI